MPINIPNDTIARMFNMVFSGKGKFDSYSDKKSNFESPKRKFQNMNSVKSKADKYTLQYPLITSENVGLDNLNAIRKHLELERSYDILTILNNGEAEVVDATSNTSISAIGDLHQNLNLKENLDAFKEENINQLKLKKYTFNETSLNDLTIPKEFLLSEAVFTTDKEAEKLIKNAVKEGMKNNKNNDKREKKASFSGSITSSDIKRINEFTPMIISAKRKVIFRNPNDGKLQDAQDIDITFGIKQVTHTVPSDGIVYFLSSRTKNANVLSRFVQFTSGEISFVRGFLFNVKDIKQDVNKAKNNSRIFQKLNSMYSMDRLNLMTGAYNKSQVIPISSLVITKDEVEEIRRQTGRDLLFDTKQVIKLMKQFSLIDFIVIDEIEDTLYTLVEGNGTFEKVRLSSMRSTYLASSKDDSKDLDSVAKLISKNLR